VRVIVVWGESERVLDRILAKHELRFKRRNTKLKVK